jgi:hypothetical protein
MTDDDEAAVTQASADGDRADTSAEAGTDSTPEISRPMVDIHVPHEQIHTWKGFFIHIATIVIGLFIAVGLEQTVEFFHHRHQLHELQEGLRAEAEANMDRSRINLRHLDLDMSWLHELHHRIDALRSGQTRTFDYPSPPDGYPGDPRGTDRALMFESVWNNARQAALVGLLPPEVAQFFNRCYSVTDITTDSITNLVHDWQKITAIEFEFQKPDAPVQPDVARMSQAQLEQYAAAVAQVYMSAQYTKRLVLIQQAWIASALGDHAQPDIGKYLKTHAEPVPPYDASATVVF